MNPPTLSLLNVFPVMTREHTSLEIAFAEDGYQELRKRVTYNDEMEMVKAVIDSEGQGESSSAMENALKASSTYKVWQNSMPYLKDVRNIHSFRNNPRHKNDVDAVNDEIMRIGGFLQTNQVLFRGGKFPENDFEISDGPISTSTMPSVARWHAVEVGGEFAILKIAESGKIRAFPFKTRGHQKLTHEYEVLLQNRLIMKFLGAFVHSGMKIVQYEVYDLPPVQALTCTP